MPDFSVKRCFIALPLDDTARADLAEAMEGIDIEGLRWTRPENLHVTLKFLGDVEDPDIPGLIACLRDVAAGCAGFELAMTGVGYLPDARRPRVLAATMDRPPPVISLFEAVEEAVYELGFSREGRAYHPHVTLGRFPSTRHRAGRRPPRTLPAPDTFRLDPTTLPVTMFSLMHSTLGGAAPVYAELASFSLTAGR